MRKREKLLAVTAGALVLALLLCGCVASAAAHPHDCLGEDCGICAVGALLRSLAALAMLSFATASLSCGGASRYARARGCLPFGAESTPVSLKVKLSS